MGTVYQNHIQRSVTLFDRPTVKLVTVYQPTLLDSDTWIHFLCFMCVGVFVCMKELEKHKDQETEKLECETEYINPIIYDDIKI